MDKLTGHPRKVFKFIYKRTKNFKNLDYIPTIEKKTVINHFSNTKIVLTDLYYLEEIGLIQGESNVALTTRGREYFRIKRVDWIELFFKSILCPIIVAFITSVLTSSIAMWLQHL